MTALIDQRCFDLAEPPPDLAALARDFIENEIDADWTHDGLVKRPGAARDAATKKLTELLTLSRTGAEGGEWCAEPTEVSRTAKGRPMIPTDLLAKLEGAECGSRELDGRIHFSQQSEDVQALCLVAIHLSGETEANWFTSWADDQGVRWFTRSVDAALTLVPAGWVYSIADRGDQGGLAILATDIFGRGISAKAKTVELALVIASLRAKVLVGGGK